jgi:hypothetical protein
VPVVSVRVGGGGRGLGLSVCMSQPCRGAACASLAGMTPCTQLPGAGVSQLAFFRAVPDAEKFLHTTAPCVSSTAADERLAPDRRHA